MSGCAYPSKLSIIVISASLLSLTVLCGPARVGQAAVDAAKKGDPLPQGTVITVAQYAAQLDAEGNPVKDPSGRFIKTSKSAKMDIGSTFDLNVSDKANVKAGPKLTMKADKVNIN